ncbi:hypothetical protein NS277_04225 [Novosphingobium barchaimii]|nr:hypothetical protein NS277_04225 [Novosphingobium barchaimii]
MKVLHVAESVKGGIATYFDEILSKQVSFYGPASVRILVPEDQKLEIRQIPSDCISTFSRRTRLRSLPHLVIKFNSEVASFKPDIVHMHSTVAGAILRSLPSASRRLWKTVYCPHGWAFDMDRTQLSKLLIRKVESALAYRTDAVVAISEHEYQQGLDLGIDPQKLFLVVSGIGEDVSLPAAAEWGSARTRVLFVGRLDRQKGFDLLLDAVSANPEHLELRAIGANVVERAGSATIQPPENVCMLGWQDRQSIFAQMAACDVVAIPSRWEGFGLVALEAMRAGKPVVASAVGGLTSIVEHGVTGMLLAKGDAEALATALMSQNRSSWEGLGRSGRAKFERFFTSERAYAQLRRLYEGLLQAVELPQGGGRSVSDPA